jgi:diphthamide biosynthesis methyltransferase
MIVALDLITSMYTHMSTTLLITGADMVATAAAQLSSSMKSNTFTREMIRNASSIIANLVSLVFGYCVHANLVEDERYIALKRHAERNPAMVASGKALAIAVMRAVPNKNAVTAGVRSSVMTLASTISSMSGLTNDADAIRIISTFDSTKVTTEAGKDEQVSLMELLKTVRGEKPEPAPSPPTNIA